MVNVIGSRVLDEATGEDLFVLERRYSRLTLVGLDGKARFVRSGDLEETAFGLKLPARVKTRARVGMKAKLARAARELEAERTTLSFSHEVAPFTVGRLVLLLAGNGLSLWEYFEEQRPGAQAA